MPDALTDPGLPTTNPTTAAVYQVGYTPATQVSLNPSTQVDSSSLTGTPRTNLDIQSLLQDNLAKQDSLFTQIQGFFTPTPEEQAQQKQILDFQSKADDLATKQDQLAVNYQEGSNAIDQLREGRVAYTGDQANLAKAFGFQQQTLGVQQNAVARQQQVALDTLKNLQATRAQKLDAAKFLYDATRNSLADTISIFNATKPENIANTVDPTTGHMIVTMKNPVSGEIYTKDVGQVQTPQRQLDNIKLAQEAGVTTPFYSRDGRTIINTQTGREYSTPEQFFADGGSFDPQFMKQNVTMGVQSLAQQQFQADQAYRNQSLAIQREQLQAGKFSVVDTGYDDWGNPVKGLLNSKTGQVTSLSNGADGNPDYSSLFSVQYPDGSTGGQCAVFAEQVCTFDTPKNLLGNSLKDKQATVNKYGITANEWRSEGAQVGDGIIFNLGQNGHVSVVTGVNSDGTVNVIDSNYGLDGKVQNRVVNTNDKSIYGVVRGQLKNLPSNAQVDASTYRDAFNNAALGMAVNKQQQASRQLQSLLAKGDTQAAKDFITRTAISTAPVEQQNQAQGRSEALAALDAIQSALKDFKAAGGNTNIFTGTEEQIANKVGATKDPKIAYLANQINQAFINYRRSMTGVAFSPQESAQYEKLFPSIGKVNNFNEAVIQSLQDTMNRNQELFLKNRIGTQNYTKLFGSTPSPASSSQDNSPEAAYIATLGLSSTPAKSSTSFSPKSIISNTISNTLRYIPTSGTFLGPLYDSIRNLFR